LLGGLANADWNTHTTINASPQLHKFNAAIWLDMEVKTQKWADNYGQIWIICGPAYRNKKPTKWIGDEDEQKVAIPDFFWKIIIKEDGDKLETMALMYPHKEIEKTSKISGKKYSHHSYLVSIDSIENMTGIDFFTDLDDNTENSIESFRSTVLWN
jgi:endonuclease G, mitochondrial